MRPNSLKEAVERWIKEPEWPLYNQINEFLDEFYTRPADRQQMITDEPPLTGNEIDDAYIGAVGEHLARRWSLEFPEWSLRGRVLTRPYFPWGKPGPAAAGLFVMDSPIAFRRRMIFTEREPLRRARWPHHERECYD